VNKLHLMHNATDRLAICRIWPEDSFVLLAALRHQSGGAVCQICIRIATAHAARPREFEVSITEIGDLLKGSADILGLKGSPVHARARSVAPLRKGRENWEADPSSSPPDPGPGSRPGAKSRQTSKKSGSSHATLGILEGGIPHFTALVEEATNVRIQHPVHSLSVESHTQRI
jgi:hypothetical protein